MPFRSLSSFIPSADELLALDLPSLGRILLLHLKSYEGLNTVFQNGRLNQDYFVAIVENRNVGLGPLPRTEPEYGTRTPEVIRAVLEAWNWLEREGLIIREPQQPANWFTISRRGEELLRQAATFEPQNKVAVTGTPARQKWDVFICHASEDKDEIARPLAEALRTRGLAVWYDEFSLKLGDSLRQSIDRGLASSRYGIVILSPHFFEKHWPQQELNGLASKEVHGQKVIIPLWHKLGFDEVQQQSPMLADRLAARTDEGLENLVEKILDAMSVEPAQP
jgi:TIR domain